MEEMKSIKKGLIPLINLLVIIALLTVAFSISGYASSDSVIVNPDDIPLRLYYDEEAPYGNEDLSASVGVSGEEYLTKNLDDGWERWSIPLGNGYFGANVFGRTESERIQLTEKTLANPYYADGKNFGGLNNFSETYIDFGHTNSSVSEYSRELDLKTAISTVSYVYNGVTYNREYFTSYPDRALVIKLTASESGALDFVLRPTIPYEQDYMYESGDKGGKEGTVVSSVADGVGKIVLSGTLEYYGVDFVGLYNVYTDGTVSATSCTNADGDTDGTITVSDAECAYIVVTLGTDYELTSDVFTSSDSNKPTLSTDLSYAMSKVEGYLSAITDRIDGLDYESAYTALKEAHLADYTELFDRVRLNLGASAEELALTTDELLESYKSNGTGSYLETLYFQYGRYLLIASSRSGALPANLQGTWNRYELSPWSAGYWHNINVQMNYWPAFSTNLSETFDAYVDYNAAYMPQAQSGATSDINSFISQGFIDSSVLGKDGGNGWSIDTGAYPYTVWGHQRNGVGNLGFTTQLFWDYYLYTGDEALLRDVVYPILADAARYITKVVALDENGEYYLVVDTDSPEQYVDNEWYYTNGTTYAQSFAFLNNYYCLEAARELGIDLSNDTLLSTEEYSVLSTVMDQLDRYDPIVIGLSGQVKEFREEEYYGDLGEYTHRHISQLVGLYPGNLINSNTPAWLDAAKVVLTERGDEATGWGVAHRINLWARTKDGERAYDLVNQIISTNTATNLWDLHPPFQIDGNLGGTAGIAEMLLQSHEGCIAPLAAIPSEWESGSYTGLVARGGFEVGAAWEGGIARTFNILSGNGGEVSVYYGNISGASVIRNSDGAAVSFTSDGDDLITFNTEVGETYIISGFSADEEPAKVSGITQMVDFRGASVIKWNEQADAESYNVYYAKDNDAAYTLLGNTTANYFNFVPATLDTNARYTFKVSAVGEGGNEGEGALCYRNPDPATVDEVSATVSDTGALQLVIKSSAAVKQFKLYKRASSLGEWTLVTESAYPVIILEDYEPSYEYGISFADASLVESRIESISSLTPVGGALDYDPTNILAGYEFVGASTSTGYIWSPYVYANLTDGSRDNMCAIAYQKAGANLDGTLTLNGAAYLNELRIYPHYQSTEYLGTSLIVQTLTGGEWATALTVSSNAEMAAYMKTVGGAACLAIPLDNVLAEQIRIYIPGCYTLSNGTQRYIGIDEIECSGFLVSDELTEDISSNAFSSLTSENVTLTGASLHPGTGGLDVLFDGTISGANATRYATLSETVGGTHTLTLDLGEAAPLYTLKIWDFRGADYVDGALATRSNETTVELLVGESWYTVINAKPMSVAAAYTEFNLLGLTASQVRITFANTRAFDDGSMPSASIYEISCTTAGKNVEDTESNILSSLTSENVTLTGASLHPATGGLDVLFDGTTSGANATRYATLSETVGGTHTLTIDLGEAAPLYTLKIWDFRGADYVGGVIATRSNETTVELFNGTEWVTVIDRQPMTVAQSHTDFALGGITASQIRITFANTRAFDDGTMPSASIYEIACTTALPEAQDYVDRSDLLLAYEELAGTSVSDLFGLDGVKAMALLRFRDMLTDAEADADTVALYAAQIREYTENVLTCAEADTYGTFSGSEISEGAETVEITYSLSASILTSCPDAYIALGFADGTELNYPVSMMESAGGAYRLSVPLTPEITAGSISTRLVADDSNYSALSTASTVACEHTDTNGDDLCDACGVSLKVYAFTYVTSGGVSTDTDDFKEALIGAGAGGVINLNRDAEYYLTATIAGNAFASNITINLNGYDLIIWQGDESGNGNTSRIQIYNRAITVNGRAEGETKNGRLLCMQLVASYGSGEGNYPLFESTGGSPSLTLNNVDTTVGALWYTAGNAGSSVTVNGGIHDISLVSRNSFGWVGAAAAFTFEANGAIFHMGLEAIGQNNGGALVADRASARSTYTFNDCVITRYSYTSSFIKYATSTSYFYFNNTDIGCGINPETYSGCTAATSANFIFGAGTRFWADYVNTKGYTVADGCVYAAIANPADKYTFTKLQGGFATETETSVTFNANGSVVCIHADENRDGVCDKCLETVDIPDCTTHTDENGNRLCDVCGADTSVRIIYVMPDGSTSEVKVAHGTLVSNFPEYEKAEDIENGWVKIIFDGGWSTERFGAAISELTVTDTVTLYPSASECRAYMTDSKYNLSLYGNVAINIHVPTSSLPDTLSLISVTDGEDNVLVSVGSVLDAVGEEYDTYTYGRIRVTELDTVQTYKVRFEFMGVEFTQTIKPSISSYAENVLSSGINSAGKTVVADMVMYADAIYKYASGTSAAISDSLVSLASGVCTAAADSATFTGGYMGDAHNYADYISMIAFNVTNFEPSYEITFREEARVRDVELIIREAWLRGDGTYNKDDLICSVEKTYSGEYVTGVKATGVSIYNVDKTITIRFTFEDENGATHTVDATYTLNSYYTGMAADGVSVTEEDLTRAKAVFERMRAYSDTAAYYCFDEESANADSSLESKIKTVYYSDFGAKGDGVTDDFAAIYAAHEEANRLSDEGYTVRVKAVGGSHSNANYYIKNLDTASETFGKAVIIRTDTDWTGATFTVDDTSVTASTYEALKAGASTPIFKASADYTTSTAGFHCHWMIGNNDYDLPTSEMIPRFADGLLNASLKYNGLPEITSEQVLVKIVDTSHRNYVRFGGNYSSVQHEDIVLMNTATGEVDPSTPLLYDYHQVSRYEIYDIGSAPITIEGGSFITKYNNAFNSQTTPEYFLRGISIERANTTLKGLTQEYDYSGTNCITAQDGMGVTVDAVKGSPMQLIFVNTAHNVTLSDMSIYGGRHYSYGSSGLGVGNYTVCAYFATQLKINNVIQHNTSTEFRQPVMATNFCKNIVFRDNVMSRFDSHMGLYNVVIDGCDLEAINLIGGGKAIISNTKVYSGISGCVVTLRDDYASVWNGDVEFKNLTIETGGSSNVALFGMAYYNYNPGYYYSTGYFADKSSTDSYYAQDTSSRESGHYYSTVMPENVTADGITILKNGTEATSGVTLSVLTQFVGRVENFTYVDENGNDTTLSKSYQLHEYQGDITTYGASVNVGIWDENFLGIWNWSSKTTVTVKNPIKTTESITISGLASGIGYAEYYDFGTDKLHTFDLVFFNPTVTVNGAAPSWSPTGKNI